MTTKYMPNIFFTGVMLALGHAGITLFVYAPIAYVLLVSGKEKALGVGVIVVLLLTPVPDIDMLLPFLDHRGITHSLVAAGCLGVAVGLAGWMSNLSSVGTASERAALGFLLGSVSIVSHLLGDVITPMGLQLFYPASQTWYSVNLVSAFHLEANRLLFVLGAVAFWLTLHHGRLRVAARDGAAERSAAKSAVSHPHGTERDRSSPTRSSIGSGVPSREPAGSDLTSTDMGD